MNKNFTVAVLGCGGRGYVYTSLFCEKEEFEVVAFCDSNPRQLQKINTLTNLPDNKLFTDEYEFLKEKIADIMVIATSDSCHVRQCVAAMELGYDVLLEKPVSDSKEEIEKLLKVQKETGRIVVVCHVMRYGIGIRKLEELISKGVLGRLVAIDHSERVAFWHQAQAYVRFQKQFPDTYATILAKCCHDLDLIQHFAASPCDTVSSVGSLAYFRRENAPEGSADRCLDCKYIDTCTYSAKKIYIDFWKKSGCPKFSWPWNKLSLINPNTEEDLYEGLKTKIQGECVFKCGVEADPHVVDNQMVQMRFKNGVIATLKMVFGGKPGRLIALYGTEGELIIDEVADTITVKPYGEEIETLKISALNDNGWGHGGGDSGLIDDMYDILTGKKTEYTSLTESVESHLIGILAEESRLDSGKTIKVH